MPKPKRRVLGHYIVADPAICHGKPTFLGTRIMVWQVLTQVAKGMSWDAISAEWRGSVRTEAIAEAVELARQAFVDHAHEYGQQEGLAGTCWTRTSPTISSAYEARRADGL
jgi:uncharacterized protein (DUF433 family)